MTLKDLLDMITVKEAVILSVLGYVGYKAYDNEKTIHLVAKRMLENEAKSESGDSYVSARSETEISEDTSTEFAIGFQALR